jgi:hypothetical protein
MSEFYVGYLPKAPVGIARFLRRVVLGLGLLALGLGLVLVGAQSPFEKATFEYGTIRTFEGNVALQPYPSLWVQHPGAAGHEADSHYLLVAPGKHGAEDLLERFDSKQVRLKGQLVFRESGSMIEIVPGSIELLPRSAGAIEATRDLGPVTLAGEIVDSKCYLGVMNPGHGKVHRDCAARCLSGGIPPLFLTTASGPPDGGSQYLLVGPDGAALGRDDLREFVAEPITIHAELLKRGDTQFLQIDAKNLRHSRM